MPGPLIEGLRDRRAYPHPARDIEVLQTHISWVVLAGAYAYKIKKPVRFPFLDYSTLAKRRRACEREVALNRRTCPEAYLGVVPIARTGDGFRIDAPGRTVEYAVKMRRLSASGWLSSRVDVGKVSPGLIRGVARATLAFHNGARTSAAIARYGAPDEVAAIWRENLDEVRPFAGDTLERDDLRAVSRYGSRFLAAHEALIAERASAGRIRDCHGDLRSDSIHVGPGGRVCLTDCIEFSDRLRCGDVAGDVGFLAMDLDFRGRADLADEFCAEYVSGAPDDETLPVMLPFYRCYRAIVRGKVESLASREPEIPPRQRRAAKARARRYFALARRYAAASAAPALFVVGGLSGTGKSYLAAALASRIGAVLVRTDAVRREAAHARPPAYTEAARAAVYAEARARAARHLRAGRPVVLDATHIARRDRDAARDVAASCGVPAMLLWLDAPEPVVRRRLRARDAAGGDVSDARWQTYLDQRARLDPPSRREGLRMMKLDGAATVTQNIARVRRVLATSAG